MKKNIKMILAIVITAIICISGTVYATTKYLASDVTYKNTTVDKALDELYNSKGNSECVTGSVKHEANTQLTIDIGFQPSQMMFNHMLGSEYDFNVYDKNINSSFMYTWKGSNNGVDANDRVSIKDGVLTTSYTTSWQRYKYEYQVYYIACK